MNMIPIRAGFLLRGLCALALAAAAPIPPAAAQEAAGPTTVILVRHAEPVASGSRDPGLGPEGRARVESLLQAVGEAGLSAVYSTQFRRTRETGAPIAEALGIPLHVVEVTSPDLEAYTRALLEHIRRENAGETVLVVGHSNTVPGFVRQATGSDTAPIGETEFDRLYVVTLSSGEPRVVQARYGLQEE